MTSTAAPAAVARAGDRSSDVPTFSERILRRHALWWGRERGRARLHRAREILFARRAEGDGVPDVWRCCPRWQRSLNNKLTARVFAQAHGCRVPDLYWTGRGPGRMPFERLPEGFVVKPSFGHACHGVHAMWRGTELIGGGRHDRASLARRLREVAGRVSPVAWMVEELVRDESGREGLPIEYKLFVFRDLVGAIEVTERVGGDALANPRAAYTAQWRPLEPWLRPEEYRRAEFARPRCLDEMLDVALRLGAAYGTFVRVDVYASPRGCVFGELSSTPSRGVGFASDADRLLGELWRDRLGDLE